MEIDYTSNHRAATSFIDRRAAESFFDEEALLFGENDGIPEYRIVEIFGGWAGVFVEKHIHFNGYLESGRDWNCWGDSSPERPMLRYLYRRGFLKVVSEHNYRLVLQAHKSSEAGHVVDRLLEIRQEALDAADREEAQKRAERKKKRDAARKTKNEQQEGDL